MDARTSRPFVTIKLTPVDRPTSFHLPSQLPEADLAPGDQVIVETGDGRALGTVKATPSALASRREPGESSPLVVVRKANREDVLTRLRQQQREQEAFRVCLMKIRERALPMKLTRIEQVFDGSRLVFYYTADGRVDFRELVRELAAHFRTRIEMRQIGVRDQAKMLNGYGGCGRPLCCSAFLQGFAPVSIKMAKQQQVSLNPAKLSGQCGRLKCCLRFELGDGEGVNRGASTGLSAGASTGLSAGASTGLAAGASTGLAADASTGLSAGGCGDEGGGRGSGGGCGRRR